MCLCVSVCVIETTKHLLLELVHPTDYEFIVEPSTTYMPISIVERLFLSQSVSYQRYLYVIRGSTCIQVLQVMVQSCL